MTPEERESVVASYLLTAEGKKRLKAAIQVGAAKAADKAPVGTLRWHMARMLAGLPPAFPQELSPR